MTSDQELLNLFKQHLSSEERRQMIHIIKFRAADAARSIREFGKCEIKDKLLLFAWKEVLAHVYASKAARDLYRKAKYGRTDMELDAEIVDKEQYVHDALLSIEYLLAEGSGRESLH